ncbi:MAG: monovalent cation:proton antiporter-2 (CPA2) family protein [Sphingomonadaceae bacterium]|uniref:monovalent cation:proton antiporter-2 (CPA2) family protein n=1 Tax=Thermaurantiacus sp. TaxID=2820283 RepID=UPI00298EDF31|nr:monovalent cation:proton antiporter-2 (CPA2) family protein [Thermaurantiacus sp.]MCS6987124.1 monovalent cation:proton antiporter-2 (CPA2) family protein [Sphingomonadaceae bacterium]MDW8415842.1 monovalent cation:proton antiporter-2 (CPA2) family protein [Thermaurantiacus sp.]
MAVGAPTEVLNEAVIYLGAAAVVVPLFARLGLGAVLGYLAAGALIGPFGLKLVERPEAISGLADFGVVLLLFVIGLELRPARLWQLRREIFGFGTLQLLACGLVLWGALVLATAFTWQAALLLGLALSLSSTALVVGLLKERGELNTPVGERAFSTLLLQDIAIVPLLIVTSALSRVPDPDAPTGLSLALSSLAAIAGLSLVGRFLLNPAFRLLARVGTREVFVIGALLAVLGASLLMASFGLSMALGAFIAGVMLADSPWRHEVEADIEPFRGLLLGLFFISVGMGLDLSILWREPDRVLALVTMLMGLKFLVVTVLGRGVGMPWPRAWRLGLLLAQGGEFAFVLFKAAVAGLLLAPEAASLFGAVVSLSMVLTLLILALVRRLAPEPEVEPQGATALEPPDGAGGTVIVVGYGRFGQIVTQMLHARGVDVVLIDRRPEQIELSRRFGWRVWYGDGFRPEVLRAAGADHARLLVVTTGGGSWDPALLEPVRLAFPHLRIVVRVHDRVHALRMLAAGFDLVVRELFHSGIEMGRVVLRELGTPEATIEAIAREYVRRDAERLALQLASGDLMAGHHTIFRPGHAWQPAAPETALGEIPAELAPPEAEPVGRT